MTKKFNVRYVEWQFDFIQNKTLGYCKDSFYYEQIYPFKKRIRDVKEYIKDRRYKAHKPVCTCCLEIRKFTGENEISICYEYNDNTYLDDTIFNEFTQLVITDSLNGNKCTCGQLKELINNSKWEQQLENTKKDFEERARQDKEYYERRLREDRNQHQNEINRLQNLMNQQQRENRQQIDYQNRQHQNEINRMQKENNRREQNYITERNANNKRLQNMENERRQEKIENRERLRTIENERNLERKENNKKFQNIENERNRERQQYTQRLDTLEHTLEEKDKILQKNTKKLEENEKQKLYIEKCEKDAENEFILNNYKIYDSYYNANKNLISEEIGKILKKSIDEEISFEKLNEDLIYKIVKREKFPKNIKEFSDEKITNLDNRNLNINISSFNIIVLGNTGVGKSTLLNTVLKEKLAKTDLCDPCTMGPPKPYESEKAKGIRIWDSRGIENGKYNLENAFNDIKNTIEALIKENDPNKFIHCIWYCIKSNRFTEEESENLKRCYDSYIEKLPIIVIFTQSGNQKETDKMIEKVKMKIEKVKQQNGIDGKEQNDIKILKVLAEDYETDYGVVKSFGIHNLMEQTYLSGKIGIERACTHSLMEQGKNFLKEEYHENMHKLKHKIFEARNQINNAGEQNNNVLFNILNEDKKKKNVLNINNIQKFDYNNFINFCKIFSRLITKSLLLKEEISEETISEIDNVLEVEAEKIKKFFEKIFAQNLENIANKITKELVDYITKLESKYKIKNLSSKYYHQLEILSKNNIMQNFKPVVEDIVFRKISQIIFKKFGDKIKEELMDCFHELLKSHKGIKEIFNTKGKEISDMCLKRIKNLMDYPEDNYEKRNPKKKAKKSKYEDLEDDDDDK